MNIKLYYMPHTRAFRVRWLLEELGLNYELEQINIFNGDANTEAYRAVHPLGYLPAVKINGKSMIESGAICTWFTDRYPEKNLAPDIHSSDRCEYEKWMYFVPGEVEPPLFYYLMHSRVLPVDRQVSEILPWLLERYTEVLKVLQRQLANKKYLLGDHFTTADIMLGSCINWLPESLQPFDALQDYVARLNSRQAYRSAMEN